MADLIYPLLLTFLLIAGVSVAHNVDRAHCAGAVRALRKQWMAVPALVLMGLAVTFFAAAEAHQLVGVMIVFVSLLSLVSLLFCAVAAGMAVIGIGLIQLDFETMIDPCSVAPGAPTDPPRGHGRQAGAHPLLVRWV